MPKQKSQESGVKSQESMVIDLSQLYNGNAKLSELDDYIKKAKELSGEGNEIILTGAAPVWL